MALKFKGENGNVFSINAAGSIRYSYAGGFPGGPDCKESACNAGDLSSIPGLGRSSGEGNGNPLQYSCLENSMTEKPGRLQSMGSKRVGHD